MEGGQSQSNPNAVVMKETNCKICAAVKRLKTLDMPLFSRCPPNLCIWQALLALPPLSLRASVAAARADVFRIWRTKAAMNLKIGMQIDEIRSWGGFLPTLSDAISRF